MHARLEKNISKKSFTSLLLPWGGGLCIFCLLSVGLAWWAGFFSTGTDPRVQEILALQQEAQNQFLSQGGPSNVSEAVAAITTMGTIFQKSRNLPPSLRGEVAKRSGSMFQSMMRAQINAYFDAPPKQRLKELDRQIKQEEMMMTAFKTASAIGGFFKNEKGSNNSSAQSNADNNTPRNGDGGKPTGPPSNRSPDGKNDWLKRIIDRTTPEERARYVEHRRAKEVRRVELGLSASPWGK
ncbi:MAG: hypothetical protein ABGW78_15125 [Pirellulales bacterium]